jgi:GT2 family glycosyltransferase
MKHHCDKVALVGRLVELDERLFAQHRHIAHLTRKLAQSAPPSHATEAPLERHDWKLASHRGHEIGPYDRRVDDAVLHEADAGAAFMRRWSLDSAIPDHHGAIAALNALCPAATGAAIKVSVVIPVFGQLAYTLNCLDSLWRLRSTIAFEVILIDDCSPDGSAALLAGLHGVRLFLSETNQGFIASCNQGAQHSTGEFVVFLNNDTRVVEGWLDALVDSFTLFPQAGRVGSKMLYPDGSLQEAGCIIWRDASCWNVGRNDDPNRPHYSFARQTDYVSGCSIMLRTAFFKSLGGFDAHYAPAYCEDSDLAMRVREAGQQVWFQPQSRVVHYEGVTSGTSTDHGVKAYQLINARKLFLRWRQSLASHRPNGDAPHLERERTVQQRALMIDANLPTPLQDAGSVTASLTLHLLQQLGYKTHFVPQDNFLFQPGPATDLMRQGIEVAYAPFETDLETYLRRHGRSFDVIMVFRVTVLEQTHHLLRRFAPQAPILFHTMDLHHLRLEREASLSGDLHSLTAAAALKTQELALVSAVDCTITHSTYERGLLCHGAPSAPVIVWPFMFPLHGTAIGFEDRQDFGFLGGYGHTPNVDAVTFFVRDILPLIHKTLPRARFIIAGANPTAAVTALAGPHVIVTGQRDDLRPVFDGIRVFACCLRVGAGTKGKISASMSYGVPVVSTSCGAEGMDLSDGEDVLLADSAADFAASCIRLHQSPALWQKLSKNGQTLVRDRHSLDMGKTVLEQAIDTGFRHLLHQPQNAMATP